MKKYQFLILLIVTILGFSCKKYDESDNYLRGIIDGQPFESDFALANKPERIPGVSRDPNLKITASFPPYLLSLMILDEYEIKEGVYRFQADKDWKAYLTENNTVNYSAGSGGPSMVHGSGSITIKEISKKYVKGSFEFTAVGGTPANPKIIANGEFSIVRK